MFKMTCFESTSSFVLLYFWLIHRLSMCLPICCVFHVSVLKYESSEFSLFSRINILILILIFAFFLIFTKDNQQHSLWYNQNFQKGQFSPERSNFTEKDRILMKMVEFCQSGEICPKMVDLTENGIIFIKKGKIL